MNRWIDADALAYMVASNGDVDFINKVTRLMIDTPSIDIELKRGEWIDKGWKGDWQFETDGRGNCWYEYECSECGYVKRGSKSNFCPGCGADMRKREDK